MLWQTVKNKLGGKEVARSIRTMMLVFVGVVLSGVVCPGCAEQEPVYSTQVQYTPEEAVAKFKKDEQADFARFAKERAIYVQALEAYSTGDMQTVKTLRRTELATYPLSIYLDFSLLQLPEASLASVQAFINSSGHDALSNRLKAYYIKRLAEAQNYKALLKISPEAPKSAGLKCLWQQARYHQGYRTQVQNKIVSMYRHGEVMAPSCIDLVSTLQKQGVLSDEDTLERMLSAYWTRGGTKIYRNAAVRLAKGRYAKAVKILGKYYDTPARYKAVPTSMGKTAAVIFRRWARQDPLDAYQELEQFRKTYHPTARDLANIKETMAYAMLFEKEGVPMHFVDSVLAKTKNVRYLEQRFRRAVWDQDYKHILAVLERLPKSDLQNDNYRYWHGRALVETGHQEVGQKILKKLAQERSFYGFYAASELGLPLLVNEKKVKLTSSRAELIKRNPSYARYLEFMFLADKFGMRTEWAEAMKDATVEDARMIAYIESQEDDTLGIWETIYKKDWGALSLRFPLSYRSIYQRESSEAKVPESFMYGITRQESMMNHKAISPVGARGLMQLMPGTATMVSKKHNLPYGGTSELLQPEVNVRLGGVYLRDLLDTFDNNRIFVSAGYNAGPGRAFKWQSKDGKRRDAITYVESIPFTETRGYVQHVIFYDYMYQYLQGVETPTFLSEAEWNHYY